MMEEFARKLAGKYHLTYLERRLRELEEEKRRREAIATTLGPFARRLYRQIIISDFEALIQAYRRAIEIKKK